MNSRILSSIHRFQTALDEGGFRWPSDTRAGPREAAHRVLVACSGGPDSVALLRLLVLAGGDERRREIVVGHVHHGARGEAADADEAFVRELGSELGVSVVVERIDVPALAARSGMSFEAAAREARYGAFGRWAESIAIDTVFVGHHRGDQEETVLLRLARGSGWRGFAAMAKSRALGGTTRDVRLLRPLLEWTRKEILAFLDRGGFPFRDDATNDDVSIPRNRVRHRVIPELERVHPGARDGLMRLASRAHELDADLAALARRALAEAIGPGGDGALVDRLRSWPRSVLREVLVILAGRVPTERATERFFALIASEDGARDEDLGAGLVAESRYGRVRIRRPHGGGDRPVEATLVPGAALSFGSWRIGIDPAAPLSIANATIEELDAASVGTPALAVRARREGDVFHPLGAPGRKKLDEFFRERRVPPDRRDGCPLVVAGERIVWVVGLRIGHPFRVTARTGATLKLWAEPAPASLR